MRGDHFLSILIGVEGKGDEMSEEMGEEVDHPLLLFKSLIHLNKDPTIFLSECLHKGSRLTRANPYGAYTK